MNRLTTNKKASEMGMYELAHNFCYVGENGSARYRDFSSDVDCREMIKKIMANFGVEELGYWDDVSDEVFDDEMMENLIYGTNNLQGLMAVFYRNMWAMADLREKLKYFEDLEEQGLLLKLPFDVNSEVFIVSKQFILERNCMKYEVKKLKVRDFNYNFLHNFTIVCEERIGDSICQRHLFNTDKIFLTKEEAEQELKRMESAE